MRRLASAMVLTLGAACAAAPPPPAPKPPPAATAMPLASSLPESPPDPSDDVARTIRLIFSGNHALTSDELLGVMLVRTVDPSIAPAVLQRDLARLRELYLDRGFLQSDVFDPIVKAANDGPFVDVTIPITEGVRFRTTRITVTEDPATTVTSSPEALRALIAQRPDEPFDRARLRSDMSAIRSLYGNAGYAAADVQLATPMQLDRGRLEVRVRILPGALIHVAKVQILGNTKTAAKKILPIIGIKQGSVWNENAVLAAKERLSALGWFRTVEVSRFAEPHPDRWTLRFEVTETEPPPDDPE